MMNNDYVDLENLKNTILEYVEKCKLKVDYHNKNGGNSRRWNSILSITNMILGAATALSMTIMSVIHSSEVEITIVGAIYAFLITTTSKVKDSYEFNDLGFKHEQASDRYYKIKQEFNSLLLMHSDHVKFGVVVSKFLELQQETHLQQVQSCRECFFCN